ncbi:hypothetical protein HRbin01_00368 [archaeon HR01]|nr:hypothetical protein HRbin01_00368 [archaeon HR01]
MSGKSLRVTIDYDGLKVDFEGPPGDVYIQTVRFLEKVLPAYSLASRIAKAGGVAELIEKLGDAIAYQEGEGVYPRKPYTSYPAPEAVLLFLGLRYIEAALGLRENGAALISEIVSTLGRPEKTISGRLSELVRKGYVRRLDRSSYIITGLGLSHLVETHSGA